MIRFIVSLVFSMLLAVLIMVPTRLCVWFKHHNMPRSWFGMFLYGVLHPIQCCAAFISLLFWEDDIMKNIEKKIEERMQ